MCPVPTSKNWKGLKGLKGVRELEIAAGPMLNTELQSDPRSAFSVSDKNINGILTTVQELWRQGVKTLVLVTD